MKQQALLYLASSSEPRARLLREAGINFTLIGHGSDELLLQDLLSFEDYVRAIACDKMRYINMQQLTVAEGTTAFFLTADTLAQVTDSKQILSKPRDKHDALKMLSLFAQPREVDVVTGYCLEQRVFVNNTWETRAQALGTVSVRVVVAMPSAQVAAYLEKQPQALLACGALMIEGFGAQFVQAVYGSYTAVLGLPMYELRESLAELGFWF